MSNPYKYSAMIENESSESEVIGLIMSIMESDLHSPETARIQRERVRRMRKLGEEKLADAIAKDYEIE